MILKEPRLNRRGYVAAAVMRWPDHVWIIMGTLINRLIIDWIFTKVDRAVPGAIRCRQGRRHPPGECLDNFETVNNCGFFTLQSGPVL
jgi:hypothetical protein